MGIKNILANVKKGIKNILANVKKLKAPLISIIFLFLAAALASSERQPLVSGDNNEWGTVLNKYLDASHAENGTLKKGINASFAFLNVTSSLTSENVIVNQNLYIIGNISNTDIKSLSTNGSLFPALDALFDVGNDSRRWRNANFSGTLFAATLLGTTIDGINVRVQGNDVQTESPAFKIANGTALPFSNFLLGNVSNKTAIWNLSTVIFENLFVVNFGNFTKLNSTNITATNITATRFTGSLDCGMLTGGSDGDFCADATGAGESSSPYWSKINLTDFFGSLQINNTIARLNYSQKGNFTISGLVNATQLNGSLSCNNIIDGSDSNYCADATGAGGGGAPTTSEYILGSIDDALTNAIAFRRSAIMYEEFVGDVIADYRISALGTPTAVISTTEPRFYGVVNAVTAATTATDGGVSLGSFTATTTAGYNATSFKRFEGMAKLTATTSQHTYIGMLSSATTQDALTVNNGFFFYYNSSNGGARWQARTCSAGVCNGTNLTEFQANTQWFNFSIVPYYKGNGGDNVSYYFNGTLVANHTLKGKLPNLVPWIGVWTETTAAAAATTRVDYSMAIYDRAWR